MPHVYRAYLRTFEGRVPHESKTISSEAAAARAAFQELVDRTDLDGQKWAAVLSCDNRQLAFHRFDRRLGDRDYWRDKVDEIVWPNDEPLPVGSLSESAGKRRVSVCLDAQSMEIAKSLGIQGEEMRGDISLGITRALEYAAQHRPEVLRGGVANINAGDDVLPDVLGRGLRVVFCGMAVGEESRILQAYYAGAGNRFWETLAEVGFTPRQLEPAQYCLLQNYRLGLTDLIKHAFGADNQVRAMDRDRDILREKIQRDEPEVLAFVGKNAASHYLQKATGEIPYGWVPADNAGEGEDRANYLYIGGTRLFVLPSPSGAARAYWDLAPWQELADAVQERGT